MNLILLIIAVVLFAVATVFDGRPRFHFGWAGAAFLAAAFALEAGAG